MKKLSIVLMCFSIFIGSITCDYVNAAEMIGKEIDSEYYEIAGILGLNNNNGEHLWEKKKDVVHHEEEGHMENKIGDKHSFQCNYCHSIFGTAKELMNHMIENNDTCNNSGWTIITESNVPISIWVVDKEAWDEVTEYYQCTICGAKKDSLDTYETITVKAIIPKSINIKGKTGTYKVMAYCKTEDASDLNTNIYISPAETFVLTDGVRNVTATVSQAKTLFSASDVKNGSDSMIGVMMCDGSMDEQEIKEVGAEGTITADDISYGTWTGNITFNISVN